MNPTDLVHPLLNSGSRLTAVLASSSACLGWPSIR